ncbi:MAG: metallopeptidase TldD-related protein [Thermodesulfobacteriota bacterium]|nr:metallopeptidase TldD-related protein [Thermodesulfobacteriota bacterium]
MKEKDKKRLFSYIFDYNKDLDFTELILYRWDSSLTRVADSVVHQHVAETNSQLFISLADGKRICSISTNSLDLQSIKIVLQKAKKLLRKISPVSHFNPPPCNTKNELKSVFSINTANYSPARRVETIGKMIRKAKEKGLTIHAKSLTGKGDISVANSIGTMVGTDFTDASLSITLTGENGVSGYGARAHPDVTHLDWEGLLNETIKKCEMQRRVSIDIFNVSGTKEAKRYDVILEPYAVADWVRYLGWLGFNSQHYQENESFICNRLGKRVLGENITIWDDGLDFRGYVMPFDFEGTPKKKTVFIENGVAKSLAYDSLLAAKEGKQSTSHALLPGMRSMGATPLNLFMEGGNSNLEEMITNSKDRTIYISRFHYNNTVNRKEAILTGMTRDGTFLIEDGEIKYPIVDLRYFQSLVEAFNNVTELSPFRLIHDPAGYVPIMPESTVVPSIKIERMQFVGSRGI